MAVFLAFLLAGSLYAIAAEHQGHNVFRDLPVMRTLGVAGLLHDPAALSDRPALRSASHAS